MHLLPFPVFMHSRNIKNYNNILLLLCECPRLHPGGVHGAVGGGSRSSTEDSAGVQPVWDRVQHELSSAETPDGRRQVSLTLKYNLKSQYFINSSCVFCVCVTLVTAIKYLGNIENIINVSDSTITTISN